MFFWHTSDIFLTVYAYLRPNRMRLLGDLSRQPLWYNILCICLFAREDAKVIDLISWKRVSIWCAIYMQKLILACIWETIVRFRCVWKVRIISTPNRNRKKCTFMRPGSRAVCAVPLSECALHSNVCAHINDLSQCTSNTLRSINEQEWYTFLRKQHWPDRSNSWL